MPIEKACENCSQLFTSYPSDNRRYCSLGCRTAHRFGRGIPAPGRAPETFTCVVCAKTFTMMQSYVDAYHKKYGRPPLYCSRQCSGVGRRKTSEDKHTFTCLECGKENTLRRKPGGRLYIEQKYCNQECKSAHQRTRALERFERGEYKRHVKRHGYVWISVPSLVTGKKYSVMEHRFNMSRHLGRDLLPDETVHHRDGNRAHNAIENLELFSSRHGPGQRVVDKVQFAIEILTLYPDFCRTAGYELHRL